MVNFAGPPVRFTISDRALNMIEVIRSDSRLYEADDPPEVLGVGWGFHYDSAGKKTGEGVIVGFYARSQTVDFEGEFYRVSGIPIVIGGSVEDAKRFEGKVLDYEEKGWFSLK